jgi:hypothetical protein
MLPALIQTVVLLLLLAIAFWILKTIIDILQLSRDVATVAGLILTFLFLVWVLALFGLLPPLTVPTAAVARC